MRIKSLALAAFGAVSITGAAQAQSVLIYEEFTLGTSAYLEAVSNLGWDSTFVTDGNSFQSELQTGDYTHVISAHQNTFAGGVWEDDLAAWALANPGAPVLISDWRVNNPQPYLAQLGFSYSGNTNLTGVFGTAGGLLDGVGGSIASPGWGIFSYGVSTGPGDIIATSSAGGGKGTVAQNGTWFFNGFLSDVFLSSPAAGKEIVTRELLVPAPGALALLGLAGFAVRRRRR